MANKTRSNEVKGHKRLGKGLEEVSHLFLSAEEKGETHSKHRSQPAPQIPEGSEGLFPGVVAITGDHRSLEKSFLVSNLAIELARRGRQVRVVDADLSFPDQPFLWGLRPTDSVARLATAEEDYQELDVVLQGPLGVKLLSLDIDFSQLLTLPKLARQRLLAGLMAFEADAQLMLVDTPMTLSSNSRLIFQLAHQIVVLAPSDALGMIDGYAVIKWILTIRPTAPVGLVVYNIRMVAEAQAIANTMSQAVSKFLDSNIANLGFLYADLNIAKSIAQRKPLVLSALTSRVAKNLRGIADKILAQEQKRAQAEHVSFFAAMNQAVEARR
jgi:flagellar biosynthesis protein FlhG